VLEEVIVTAQKRSESIINVPIPVTAVSADTLVSSNQLRIQDYYTRIPGLSLALVGDGAAPTITIRGVTTGGFTNPTVGIVVDDLPYGSSTSQGSGYIVPEINPSDLERVEVLRGPQGTLYGASSIGGLLKFVTVDPSTERLSGDVQSGLSSVRNGDGLGYNVRGSVNVPLGDTWAVRASGFTVRDAGYVDNVQTGEEGVNSRDVDGGRVAVLWEPSEDFSLKLGALIQESTRHGADEVHLDPGLTDLQQSALRDTGQLKMRSEVYSATLSARIGSAEWVSATGYSLSRTASNLDVTAFFGGTADFLFGVAGSSGPFLGETRKLSQEIRFSVPLGPRVEWLAGVFYTDEDVDSDGDYLAVDPGTGAVAGNLLVIKTPSKYEEYAAFTNFTFNITDRFDIQLGGRLSENEQSLSIFRTGPLSAPFFGSDPSIVPEVNSKDTAFTYLVTPRFRVSPDLMLYARLASGYRPGGANVSCSPNVPCEYTADTTLNYEVGIKGKVLDERLSFDASVYYIDWEDLQTSITDFARAPLGFTVNTGKARSQGAELSFEAKPLAGLTLSAWVAWNDATLREAAPQGAFKAQAGDRLPYSSRLSGAVDVVQEFPLSASTTGFVGAAVSYVDDRQGNFAGFFSSTPERQLLPSYKQIDLRAGLRRETWELNLFATNLDDERGVLTGGLDKAVNKSAFNYIQPRVIGLSFLKSF
jgi:outer membrane receptor protein involved in Fe transport